MGANTSWQYEAPKMPSGWSNDDEKRRFYNRLIEVLDEIYLKYGRINEKMLSVTVRKTLEEAGGIVTEVVDARGDKSTLAQRINEIVSRVEDVDGDFSEISQTVDTITIVVGRAEKKADDAQTAADKAQSSVDNLEVGGRNLLQNNYIVSKLRSDSTAELEPISAWAENFVNSAEFAKIFEAGVQYTFSFDYEITAVYEDKTYSSSEHMIGFLLYSPSNPSGLPDTDLRTWRKTGVGTKGHVSKSFVLNEIVSDAKILMYTNRYTNGWWDTVKFSNIKIERGNQETDWTPAPEDTDGKIDNAQSAADNAQTTANGAKTAADNAQTTANGAKTAADAAQSTADSANKLALSANTGIQRMNEYVQIKEDGTHMRARDTDNEMVLSSQGVEINVGGQNYSQFGAMYVQFGNYQLRRTADGGLAFKLKVNKFFSIAATVRAGMGETAYPVGAQLAVEHSEYGTILFDVAAHNHHKKPGDENAPTMTLLMHHCIYSRPIDASELLWANTGDSALAAGTYNFTLYKGSNSGQTYEDGIYQFTTTKPIPAGGGWAHNKVGTWYANAADYKPENITSGTVTTYDAAGTVLESGLAVTAGGGGTALGTASNAKADCVNTIGTFNSVMRRAYGSNNWAESAARQWLNSSAAANGWWQRQTIFDLVPNYANKAGFLAGLDPDFVDALGAVDITTARNAIYEMGDTLGGSYTTRDKLFLPSMTEIGLGSNNSVAEGSVLPLYDGVTQTDRIKYDQAAQTAARYWWLRSPDLWNAPYVRFVHPSGALNYGIATYSYGLAAACVIY